jgi:uncharacterized membrane protein
MALSFLKHTFARGSYGESKWTPTDGSFYGISSSLRVLVTTTIHMTVAVFMWMIIEQKAKVKGVETDLKSHNGEVTSLRHHFIVKAHV